MLKQAEITTSTAIVSAWPRVCGGVLAALALCGVCGFAATPSDPPPHRDVGQRLVPADVDWANPVYQTAFNDPAELKNWKIEGGRRASIEQGRLVLENSDKDDHLVCWLKTEAPADFLLEFSVRPQNRKEGLNIVFFNARGARGESVFDPTLKPRNGNFRQYHSGDLNNYHISYWAPNRGTVNVRKNAGFHLVATGTDLIADAPADAFQVVRLYKRGGKIRLMVGDIIAVAFDDDGKANGPVWTHSGWIALRQMGHTARCEYEHLKIFPLLPGRGPGLAPVGAGSAGRRGRKSETRNPKPEGNPKTEIRKPKSAGGRSSFASGDSFRAAHLTAETRRAGK